MVFIFITLLVFYLSEIPLFNVAELPSDALLVADLQRTFYSYEEYNKLMQQLNSCRELLSESEGKTLLILKIFKNI